MNIWIIKIECALGRYLDEKSAKICEIQNTYDLSSLCDFILDSFEFDHDHLHEFFVAKKPNSMEKRIIEDESTMLQDIYPLAKTYALFMHFDFGDDWFFQITRRLKQATFNNTYSYPRIIEHISKNPEQYPMCDEDEE